MRTGDYSTCQVSVLIHVINKKDIASARANHSNLAQFIGHSPGIRAVTY
jgi:hypothetical protein